MELACFSILISVNDIIEKLKAVELSNFFLSGLRPVASNACIHRLGIQL